MLHNMPRRRQDLDLDSILAHLHNADGVEGVSRSGCVLRGFRPHQYHHHRPHLPACREVLGRFAPWRMLQLYRYAVYICWSQHLQ